MSTEQRPGHLRPVPTEGGEATARAQEPPVTGTPDLTPPTGRGTSSMFLTDVVALGYNSRDRPQLQGRCRACRRRRRPHPSAHTFETAVTDAIDDEDEPELGDVSELRESAGDAPVIKLVYSILGQAVSEGASDIHFEAGEDSTTTFVSRPALRSFSTSPRTRNRAE